MESLEALLQRLWDDYAQMNPQASKIHRLLEEKGEGVANDHIAFRTLSDPLIGVDALALSFINFGYQPKGEYAFEAKKLRAKHYEHPMSVYPKVFISELLTDEFSRDLQDALKVLVRQIPEDLPRRWDFCASGRPWPPTDYATYERLKGESEYAAWFSIFGFRANHFTVNVNELKGFDGLQSFNQFLKDKGFKLNASGGEIKGSPQELLEQSSTMADPVEVAFSDGKRTIPGCYYEFARRYPMSDGRLFGGFIAKSADKIFESTDNK